MDNTTMQGEALPEDSRLQAERVAAVLGGYSYSFSSEVELHAGMAEALTRAGMEHAREHVAGPRDRFDFLLPGGIVIEAKIKRSLAQALAQCLRYAERDDVRAVVLVASRFWAMSNAVEPELAGKPFVLVRLQPRVF